MAVNKEVHYTISGNGHGLNVIVRTEHAAQRLTIAQDGEGPEERVSVHKSQLHDLIEALQEIEKAMPDSGRWDR